MILLHDFDDFPPRRPWQHTAQGKPPFYRVTGRRTLLDKRQTLMGSTGIR
ncbi:MAG: hypothetical protein WD005_05200 [Haliea sp.]